jgi:hypothetical protein
MQDNKGDASYVKREVVTKTCNVCCEKKLLISEPMNPYGMTSSVRLRYALLRIERTGPAVPPFLSVTPMRQ